MSKHEQIFENTSTEYGNNSDDEEPPPMMADELGLNDDEVIPFPYELHSSFGEEMMHCFDTDILILLHPGTGNMIRGCLSLHRYCICVCKTKVHKELIQAELQKWVNQTVIL